MNIEFQFVLDSRLRGNDSVFNSYFILRVPCAFAVN
jgi:hypothetical protein